MVTLSLLVDILASSLAIHVILAWNEIGRSAIFGREIGVPDREVFSRRKEINFSGKNCYFQHCRSL